MLHRLILITLATLLTVGCKKSTPPPVSGKTSKTESVADDPKEKRPTPVERTSMAGNWVVQTMIQQRFLAEVMGVPKNQVSQPMLVWHPIAVIKVTKAGPEKYEATLLRMAETFKQFSLSSSSISAKSGSVVISHPNELAMKFHFNLKSTVARGYSVLETRPHSLLAFCEFQPARLVAVFQDDLAGFTDTEKPSSSDEFLQVLQATDAKQAHSRLLKFVKESADSPLAILAQLMVIRALLRDHEAVTETALTEAALKMSEVAGKWGDGIQQSYRSNVAYKFTVRGLVLETVVKLMQDAEADAKTIRSWKDFRGEFRSRRHTAEIVIAAREFESKEEKERKRGVEVFARRRDEYPFHPLILFGLARDAADGGKLDEAIDLFAMLVTLPNLSVGLNGGSPEKKATPEMLLERYWKKKHGNTDGLEAHLAVVYSNSIDFVVKETVKRRPEKRTNRTVLCELFTSGSAVNTVAPEIAMSAITRTYDSADVITLRYHMNSPPGPLMNKLSDFRGTDYKIARPPALFLNGDLQPYATSAMTSNRLESMMYVPIIYRQLRRQIDARLATKETPPEISLKASRKGDTVSIFAHIAEAPEASTDLRLRIAVAEERVIYKSANGIRQHEMIVRHMPGGFEGIKPKDSKFQFSAAVSLKSLRDDTLEFLRAYEERSKVKFPTKPMELKNLHVVAFLQNIRTREILQAVSVSVDGPVRARSPIDSEAPAKAARPKSRVPNAAKKPAKAK